MADLNKLRDKLAEKHYEKRAKIFDVNDFSKEVIAVESYKLGFDAAIAIQDKALASDDEATK